MQTMCKQVPLTLVWIIMLQGIFCWFPASCLYKHGTQGLQYHSDFEEQYHPNIILNCSMQLYLTAELACIRMLIRTYSKSHGKLVLYSISQRQILQYHFWFRQTLESIKLVWNQFPRSPLHATILDPLSGHRQLQYIWICTRFGIVRWTQPSLGLAWLTQSLYAAQAQCGDRA
jgi:hypothetical protein